jgi:IS5 family transposase
MAAASLGLPPLLYWSNAHKGSSSTSVPVPSPCLAHRSPHKGQGERRGQSVEGVCAVPSVPGRPASESGGLCQGAGSYEGATAPPEGANVAYAPEAVERQRPTRPHSGAAPLADRLRTTLGLVRQVLAQTRARVFRGNRHFPAKVVSVFEPHTEIIRKGKLAKPTESGRRVKIQETEAQFITDYEVCAGGQPERDLWAPALDRHIALFGRAPRLAVADGGFASRINARAAQDRGVRHVVLPRQPREKRSRIARAALRWRTGSEGRISTLTRCHGLRRCRYRGEGGMRRWVGLGLIANDLLVLGRAGP